MSSMDEKKIRSDREQYRTDQEQYREDPAAERKTEDMIREMAEEIEIPHSVTPEAVEEALEKRRREQRRSRFRKSGWKYLAGAAAACLCLAVGIQAGYQALNGNRAALGSSSSGGSSSAAASSGSADTAGGQEAGSGSYGENRIVSAKDYDEVYDYIEARQEYLDSMSESTSQAEARSSYAIASNLDSASSGTVKSGNSESYSGMEGAASWSDTNVREEGVGEGDVVKTDGENLYILNGQKINIVSAAAGDLNSLSEITMEESDLVTELYVENGRLVVVYSRSEYEEGTASADSEEADSENNGAEASTDIAVISGGYYRDYTCADVYDVSSPADPVLLGGISQSGYYNTMRVKDGCVYLLSNYYADTGAAREDVSAYIPEVQDQMIDASDIYMPDGKMGDAYTVISAFSLEDPANKTDSKAVFGSANLCYVSGENIYITEMCFGSDDSDVDQTSIRKISYENGTLAGIAQAKVDGFLNDSFSIDEYEGYLRLVTTISPSSDIALYPMPRVGSSEEEIDSQVKDTNALFVLDGNLETVGEIRDLAEDESVYSARFMGDTGYFVTFRQVDPLFSVDLSDPSDPKIIGELKIPGFSEYLHPYGEGLLLGIGMDVDESGTTTEGVKLSMFDISDPSSVQEIQTYVIDGMYSTNVYDYKAVFADAEKNLFGFTAYGDSPEYCMFSYDAENGFTEVFSRTLGGYGDTRGLYVGDVFYLVEGRTVESYTLNGFEKIDDIVL